MRRLLLALALLLGACGGGDDGAPSQSASDAKPISFTAPAVGGGEIDASDYAGRDLVLWFWSPW